MSVKKISLALWFWYNWIVPSVLGSHLNEPLPLSLYSAIFIVSFHNEPEKTARGSHVYRKPWILIDVRVLCLWIGFLPCFGVECVKCIIVSKWPLYCILWSCKNRLCALFSTTTEVIYACEEQQYLNRVYYTDFEASLSFFCLDWTTISTVKVLYYAFSDKPWSTYPCY